MLQNAQSCKPFRTWEHLYVYHLYLWTEMWKLDNKNPNFLWSKPKNYATIWSLQNVLRSRTFHNCYTGWAYMFYIFDMKALLHRFIVIIFCTETFSYFIKRSLHCCYDILLRGFSIWLHTFVIRFFFVTWFFKLSRDWHHKSLDLCKQPFNNFLWYLLFRFSVFSVTKNIPISPDFLKTATGRDFIEHFV